MLIDFESIANETIKEGAMTEQTSSCSGMAESNLKLSVAPLLGKGCAFQFVSNGHWSMHNLLQLILDKTGPAFVYISSYAFSEIPARMIAEKKTDGLIKTLACLIDSRVDVRSAGALQLLKNTADRLKLCATHAKVTVIANKEWHFTVVGSANYTTNKRYESGLIFEDKQLADKNIHWIMKELNSHD